MELMYACTSTRYCTRTSTWYCTVASRSTVLVRVEKSYSSLLLGVIGSSSKPHQNPACTTSTAVQYCMCRIKTASRAKREYIMYWETKTLGNRTQSKDSMYELHVPFCESSLSVWWDRRILRKSCATGPRCSRRWILLRMKVATANIRSAYFPGRTRKLALLRRLLRQAYSRRWPGWQTSLGFRNLLV